MKALIIRHHHFPYLLIYMEKINFCGALCTLLEYFHYKMSPLFKNSFVSNETFTKLALSNIMKHGESDVEWQISKQGIHLSVFWNYLWKGEGSFKDSRVNTLHII